MSDTAKELLKMSREMKDEFPVRAEIVKDAANEIVQLRDTLEDMLLMWEAAANEFNWGASVLSGKTIAMMNETPIAARKVLLESGHTYEQIR